MAEGVRPPHIEGKPVNNSTYMNYKCRCQGCTAAHTVEYRKWRQKMVRDARSGSAEAEKLRKKMNKRTNDRAKRDNEESRATRPNTGKPWSEEDLAVALDRRYSARQAAEMLGRTMFSVKQIRADHRGR